MVSPKQSHRKIFSALDGMRGMAAILVLMRHVPDKTVDDLLPGSYLAVDLFFVLSGFVLTHSYLSSLRTDMSAGTFMLARLIRLYPLYILGTLLCIPHFLHPPLAQAPGNEMFGLGGWTQLLASLALAVVFLPAPSGISPNYDAYPLNFPAWSLFFELFINVIFALLAPRLTSGLLRFTLLCGLVLLMTTVIYFGNLNVGAQLSNFWGGGGRVVYSFFAGVAIYQLWTHGFLRWFRLSISICAVSLLILFALEREIGGTAYDLVVTSVVFPLLVLGAAAAEPRGWLLSACRGLGRASYAIYILQVPLIFWIAHAGTLLSHREFKTFGLGGSLVIVALVTVAALFFDRYYDSVTRSALSKAFMRVRHSA